MDRLSPRSAPAQASLKSHKAMLVRQVTRYLFGEAVIMLSRDEMRGV